MFSESTTRHKYRGGHSCGGAEGVSKFVPEGEEQDEDSLFESLGRRGAESVFVLFFAYELARLKKQEWSHCRNSMNREF
jgi:hypothetical protein